MTAPFAFKLQANDGNARLGEITTPRGIIRTPAFMPVGTAATVKAVFVDTVKATGADVILGNTYHLMLRPGAERIARLGGLHPFMRWDGPILTDSGGYQVMSLNQLRTVSERGVAFRSHIDGAPYDLTPERSIEVQNLLGADIQMQFDECTPYPATRDEAERSMQLSLRWAERSLAAFEEHGKAGRALFGIVQGGVHPELRAQSAEALTSMSFHGYSVGGLAVGEGQKLMFEMLSSTTPLLPPINRATSWASVRLPTLSVPSSAASTCSIASCRQGPAGTVRPLPGPASSTCATPRISRICAHSTKQVRAQRPATTHAPTSTI